MSSVTTAQEQALLDRALCAASDTQFLTIDPNVRHDAAAKFAAAFGDCAATIVADPQTFAAAGRDAQESLRRRGIVRNDPFLFPADVYAEYTFVEQLQEAVSGRDSILIAVGSGTINDLTKLVAHRLGRPYMVVATAASMDGYTAYGASITYHGSKQTFDCPAPRAVLADLDVMARAPAELTASGYADLLAKGVAGADWILADAAGEEPIDPAIWDLVQGFLPLWVSSPGQIAKGDPKALRRLVTGLMISGFAMQAARSSRPASGAEHQFSHLWDMQHHTHNGVAPSHGFKVGIGTLASLDLYEFLLHPDLSQLDVEAAIAAWPPLERIEARIANLIGSDEVAMKASEEMRAKYRGAPVLRSQLLRLRDGWPALRARLTAHLAPFRSARSLLREAGCPSEPEQIGISRDRLRQSYEQAYYIRRRYTVLDFIMRCALFERALDELFGSEEASARRRSQT